LAACRGDVAGIVGFRLLMLGEEKMISSQTASGVLMTLAT
jgi:hypothetical protein